ncbi:MAG: flagellar basal-body MS-ring/collar protein FliF [Thermotogota bacterium]
MGEIIERIKEWWNSQTKNRKTIYISIASAILLIIIITVILSTRITYKFLMGGVTEANGGRIITTLDEMGIKYNIRPSGSIYVDYNNVEELRMRLATQGVLGGTNQGYELLQNQGFGATSYDKQVNYQIALEGELSNTISSISGVQFAKVHLVIPPRTYYQVDENSVAKASVLLMLDNNYRMKDEQIRGIVNFLTGSVQGLTSENVKVVDNFSNNLTDQIGSSEVGSADTKFKLKTQIEDYYSKKVEQNLQSVFGLGNVVVISEINLDWEKLEEESRQVEPVVDEDGIILSQQTQSESSSSGGEGQAPGTTSNIPPFTYETEESTGDYYSSSNTITNYDVNEIYRKTVQDKSGDISNKSITVFIDFANANITETDELRTQINKAVSTAVGTMDQNITVLSMAFNRAAETQRAQYEQDIQERNKRIIMVITIIIAIVLITFLLYIFTRIIKKRRTFKFIEERKRKLENRVQEIVSEGEEEEIEEYTPSQEAQRKLEDIVKKRPDDVAEILKLWLNSK